MHIVLRSALLFLVLSASFVLGACRPAIVEDDAIRGEFLEACEGSKEYQSMPPASRSAYCACGYDRAMARLTDEEKPVAQFHLLELVGVNAREKKLVTQKNFRAMGKASSAIAVAVQQCG